ncbi:MAG TPA: hypothetical protein VGO63_01185 [Candidatus Paceibacterota bacterium]|jgi:hypothetical protein|nr:hypothetical protein [Candidatus Paceibacterota bacterium]
MIKYKFKVIILLLLIIVFLPSISSAFVVQSDYSSYEPAGLVLGVWHGLLVPWSLIARWFISDIGMYAIDNTGWFYDAGFLIGASGSIPFGWLAAIISAISHIFFY